MVRIITVTITKQQWELTIKGFHRPSAVLSFTYIIMSFNSQNSPRMYNIAIHILQITKSICLKCPLGKQKTLKWQYFSG
jgi:hypothetical protein